MDKVPKKPMLVVNILLLKDGTTVKSALKAATVSYKPKERLVVHDRNGAEIGKIFIAPSKHGEPKWFKYLKPFVTGMPDRVNAITSGVMFVPVNEKLFAITFGYGRALLTPECWEEQFGLRVVLNGIPEDRIRSISKKSLDSFAHQSQTQGISEGKLNLFGVDFSHDLLRAVVGTPEDVSLGERLAGKDALVAHVRGEICDLPKFLRSYQDMSTRNEYKNKYPGIDRMSPVESKQQIEELTEQLVKKMQNNRLDKIWLVAPDLVEWERAKGFTFSEKNDAQVHKDLDIDEFLKTVRDQNKLSIQTLKTRRAFLIDAASENPIDSWPINKCIHCEIEKDKNIFVYSEGKWFRIDKDFVQKIDRDIERWMRPIKTLSLPSYSSGSEPDYNKKAASSINGLSLMDRMSVHFGGKRSSIEFCDLLSSKKEILHVKRYGASSKLSHLFAQGANAAELFFQEEEFRDEVRALITNTRFKSIVPKSKPKAEKYTVGFVILGRDAKNKTADEVLPFFSRLTMWRCGRRLEKNCGYKVSLIFIP